MNTQRLQLIVLSILAASSVYSAISIAEIKGKLRQPVLTRQYSTGLKPAVARVNSNVDLSRVTTQLDGLRLTLDSLDSNVREIFKNTRR